MTRVLPLLVLFVLSLPAVTTRLYASDEIQYFAYLRSLWFDHDLSFENEYRYFYDKGIARAYGFHETFLELTTDTGRRINFATIGSALLWAPFYGVGDLTARALRAAGAPVDVDGFSHPYIAAVTYGSAVYGFLAILLSIAVAQRVIGAAGRERTAAFLVWIGTPLVFYMYVTPGMSHAVSAFVVATFLVTWLRVRARWSLRGLVALGALASLMAMVREQDVFSLVGPAADFAWTLGRRLGAGSQGRRDAGMMLMRAVPGGVAFGVCFLPQAWAYLVLNGRLGPSPYVSAKMYWLSPHALRVLLSPEHGFLFWTPLAAFGLVGLGALVSRPDAPEGAQQEVRRLAICCALMVAAQVYVAGSVDTWSVAGAFGQRRFVALTPLLTLGLAALVGLVRRPSSRAALAAGVTVAVWWNLGLMAQFGTGMMDRQRLELGRNAYNTFVLIPTMLPELAYRYLFDRASFYQVPER